MQNRREAIAVRRLHLPDGRVLSMQVVELDVAGRPCAYHSLRGEEAFTQWRGGDFYWDDELGINPIQK